MLIDAPKGLKDVVVTTTLIGDVNGAAGYYHYREHDAIELARTRSFEDVWFLFAEGRLPDDEESAGFRTRTAALRQLPDSISEVLPLTESSRPVCSLTRAATRSRTASAEIKRFMPISATTRSAASPPAMPRASFIGLLSVSFIGPFQNIDGRKDSPRPCQNHGESSLRNKVRIGQHNP